jgi:nitrogen regulatory protein P-II 1
LRHPFSHAKIAKLEVVLPDKEVKTALEIIHQNGKTAHSGDGIIYITEVSEMVKVKSLEPDLENRDL